MGYRNAKAVLPPQLLAWVQQYVEGECLYIPRRDCVARIRTDQNLHERNTAIWQQYQDGCPVQDLAQRYFLSPQAIYKILSKFR